MSFCVTLPLAVALFVLAALELRLYTRIGKEPLHAIARSGHNVAILEIVFGLANTIALVCGIVLLVNSNKYRTL